MRVYKMYGYNNRLSASCFEIGAAPKATEEVDFFDDYDDDDNVSRISLAVSQRSSVTTADSGRASSRSTLKSQCQDSDGKQKQSKKMVVCRVALLDGTTFEPKGIDKNSLGSVVFEKVTKHLDVIETDYFGLTYRDKSGKKFWLDNTKKISKQVKGGTWVFEFQVKFYPPDPQALKEDVTRYQLCLQLRVDIFNGKLPCSFNTYALLGSFTVQSELGDYDALEDGKGTDYLNDFDFAPTQTAELLDKIAELHKHHKGQTPTVAEAHFLENAKKLAMYGVDMHDVKDSDNKDLSLGVCASGLLIYKDRLRINRFVWPKILKLSYKRNSFYIKIRPGEFEPHERTIGFKCENHKLAKRLWKTCVEHHAFFRLKDADAPSSSTLFPRFNTRFRYSGRTAHQAREAAEQTAREEPHIARTAERRSMIGHDKSKSADDSEYAQVKKGPRDENDMYDQKGGDPNATAGYGQDSMSDPYGNAQYQGRPGEDAADMYDQKGVEPVAEGPPGYVADSSLLSDGKKSKKEKEEEKKRKKEEEKRKKEEEKERKRLEKERKKGQGKLGNEVDDPALLEQILVKENNNQDKGEKVKDKDADQDKGHKDKHDKEHKHGGSLFGKFGKKSPKDKSLKGKSRKDSEREKEEQQEQKPKPIPMWQLPGIQEMMDKKAAKTNQEAPIAAEVTTETQEEPEVELDVPRIEVEEVSEAENLEMDPDVQEYEAEYQSKVVADEDSEERQSISSSEGEHSVGIVEEDKEGDATGIAVEVEEDHSVVTVEVKGDDSAVLVIEDKIDSVSSASSVEVEPPPPPPVLTEAELKEDFTQMLRETPDITSRSQLQDVEEKLKYDPRYRAVDSDARRQEWFNEYVDKMLKDDFMRLLRETPSITSQSTWNDAKQEIDLDPRYQAVPTDAQREEWFNEYVQNLLKSEYLQLLKETPSIHSQSSWLAAREYIQYDPRFMAVPSETQREAWFEEYLQTLKKEEFMQLLAETPDITSYSRYNDAKEDLSNDPRFHNVDSDSQREAYFNEYIQNLKKDGYRQLLQDTPDITANTRWGEAKPLIDTDPRYHAVDSDVQRAKWFNEYVNDLAGRGYYGGLDIGNYKSIDRKQEYLPIEPPKVTVRNDSRMPFFEPPVENDAEAEAEKRKPPPVAKKPRVPSGYDSEEDRLRTADVPVTVETESYKYNPDSNDVPKSTSNIPIVETKTHKVTYEKDGIPYETEDTILISSQSVTTKTETIDTTTYKTERDGVVETHMTTKITVVSDEDDQIDHDALLRAAIERVTDMNPDISVEKIVCMRQIEEVNGDK